MSDGYSVFPSGGSWFVRWSEWHGDKLTQPSHKLCPPRFSKTEAKAMAAEYMTRVRRTNHPDAGASVNDFVTKVFFPANEQTLAKETIRLYRRGWKSLEPHIGHERLRDVQCSHIQNALDKIHTERGDTICHDCYIHIKVTASAIFAMAMRKGFHPGPNPEDETKVRDYGHHNHRPNEAYSLQEIKQFLTLFPSGQIAVTIGLKAFLALRAPELKALTPDDFDGDRVRIWKDTKTHNSEYLPVIPPLKRLLANGWEPIDKNALQRAERAIKSRIKKTSLRWKGWYGFRRGMASNLYQLGVPSEVAALILRNSPEVVRAHYIKFEKEGKKIEAMALLTQAYDECAVTVQ